MVQTTRQRRQHSAGDVSNQSNTNELLKDKVEKAAMYRTGEVSATTLVFYASVVQLDLEQGTSNSQVTGSSPVGCTNADQFTSDQSRASKPAARFTTDSLEVKNRLGYGRWLPVKTGCEIKNPTRDPLIGQHDLGDKVRTTDLMNVRNHQFINH